MKQIDPSEINIINYLTGQLTAEEMKQFELQLDENQVLREQVEAMKMIKSHLGHWKNDDIVIPTFIPASQPSQGSNQGVKKPSKTLQFPNWMKYVAAILGFVFLLQLTGFKVNHSGNTLLLSFGEPASSSLDAKAMDELVAKAVDKYAKLHNSQLIDFKNQINSDLLRINTSVDNISLENKSNIAQLTGVFNQNLNKQYVSLESMIKGIEDNQRQELEDSFTGFVEYIDNKRIQDQYKIQNAFNEIATAINNQQFQTNALLTSITEEDPVLKSY